ncbi:MAG TPA: iron-containing alcohol dehydrogenase [bacterium]|uniref:NAD-dependent methanol dehydrogenase n=1 Tax=candidate division TA06 bacterium ADurb.Bin417 TaxID=1852828 RepID=A0A1V5MJG3_UNCT6|nr:MAG: NAD-dependent methanol dehydrogenase [candidate division TA06 bacterium ADurb.Bin417]HNQ34546.1 iron-containing alcohol dehydrogenase [bacterium]HNS49025.1 iron-containing alcohol dehydrogenase [bacterium]
MKIDFTLRLPKKISFGAGRFETLAEEANLLAASGKVLCVLDPAVRPVLWPRIEKTALAGRAVNLEIPAGEPTVEAVDRAAETARAVNPELVIGIGGGSAMDFAKALAALIENPGSSEEYRGQDRLKKPCRPKIMVPTTAGTGSEISPTAVLIGGGRKGGINSPDLIPETALLDPELTLDLPAPVTVASGLDAFCHALESYLSVRSTPFSEPLSLQALELLVRGLPAALAAPGDLPARTDNLLGSLLAGITLASAGVIANHSLSYPLGARHGIGHGLANGIMLPYVVRACLPEAAEKLAKVADRLGVAPGASVSERAVRTADFIFEFEARLGFKHRLRDLGVRAEELEAMAAEASQVAVPIANTPRPMNVAELAEIYRKAY